MSDEEKYPNIMRALRGGPRNREAERLEQLQIWKEQELRREELLKERELILEEDYLLTKTQEEQLQTENK